MMSKDGIKRTFEEELILKKFCFERSNFLRETFGKLSEVKAVEFCKWRDDIRRVTGVYSKELAVRRKFQPSELTSFYDNLGNEVNYTNVNSVLRCCEKIREKTAIQTQEWQEKRNELNQFFTSFKVIE